MSHSTQAKWGLALGGAADRPLQGPLEGSPVRQTRERIGHIGVADFLQLIAQIVDLVDRGAKLLFQSALLLADEARRLHHVPDFADQRLVVLGGSEPLWRLRQVLRERLFVLDEVAERAQHPADRLVDLHAHFVEALAMVLGGNVARADLFDLIAADRDAAVQQVVDGEVERRILACAIGVAKLVDARAHWQPERLDQIHGAVGEHHGPPVFVGRCRRRSGRPFTGPCVLPKHAFRAQTQPASGYGHSVNGN